MNFIYIIIKIIGQHADISSFHKKSNKLKMSAYNICYSVHKAVIIWFTSMTAVQKRLFKLKLKKQTFSWK